MTADSELRASAIALDAMGIEFMTVWTPQGWRAPKGFPRRELLCCPAKGGKTSRINVRRLLGYFDQVGLP